MAHRGSKEYNAEGRVHRLNEAILKNMSNMLLEEKSPWCHWCPCCELFAFQNLRLPLSKAQEKKWVS